MNGGLENSAAVLLVVEFPREVIWSYVAFGAVLAVGLVTIFVRGKWQTTPGFEKLLLFGPLFYAAPLAGFGTEHFTLMAGIAPMVPDWIPWHLFWTCLVGACFVAAAFSLVTGIQARLSACLLGLTFFLFVVLMDLPGWAQDPRSRFAPALALRELSFSGGALALAGSLTDQWRERGTHFLATIARYFIAVAILFYSFEQFRHGNYVPAIPLNRLTPEWIYGHAIWTDITAVVYLVAGVPLLIGKKTRAAATWIGWTVFLVELVVYVPIGIVERATIVGFNYMADTLMFCGAILLLAGAMPREGQQEASADLGSTKLRDSRAMVS